MIIRNLKKNQKGSAMMQVLIAAAIFLIISVVMLSYFDGIRQTHRLIGLKTSTEILKLSIIANLANYEAWQRTIALNPGTQASNGMDCLTAGPCVNDINANIDLYNANGDAVVLTNTPSSGLNLMGETCNTFVPYPTTTTPGTGVAPGGDDDCPIHVEISWFSRCCVNQTGACNPATCNRPINYVRSTYFYNPANEKSFPPFNFAAPQLPWTNRVELSSDSPYVECGMETWVYIGKPLFTMVMPAGTFTSDIRGCITAAAFRGPPGS